MGAWTITIKGHGTHHNVETETDADRMSARFVKELLSAGHTIERAEFTLTGESTDITHGAGYEEGRAAQRRPNGGPGLPTPKP